MYSSRGPSFSGERPHFFGSISDVGNAVRSMLEGFSSSFIGLFVFLPLVGDSPFSGFAFGGTTNT